MTARQNSIVTGFIIPILFIVFSCADTVDYTRKGESLDPYEQARSLGKGLNFGNMLDAFPNEGDWSDGIFLKESDFDQAKKAGFDTIRLPVCFSFHARTGRPYTLDPEFMKRVDEVISWGLERGFRMVLDNHHSWHIMKNPSRKEQKRLFSIWKQIASRYRDYPGELYYEIMNEPTEKLTPELWNGIQKECLREIRKADSYHTVIVSGAEWSSVAGLLALEVPKEESNIIVSFHYYNPQLFVMQGSPWNNAEYATTGIVWPGPPDEPLAPSPEVPADSQWVFDWIHEYNSIKDPQQNPAGPGLVVREIAQALEWAEKHRRPLWVGEFGTYNGVETVSRNNWIRFVRQELERNRIPWAFWSTASAKNDFLIDRKTGEWLSEISDALGLAEN
ncbi:MAG: glycoside hydrolase family 5 protein [Spirochaetales bacterium]|nr:glycoside hydrolase family 5 protein [Spirochaetales bacterium]